MTNDGWLYLMWVFAAGLLGFFISAVFAGRMQLSRRIFLIPYVVLTGMFLYAFVSWNEINPFTLLKQNWIWGVIAGVIAAVFLIKNVRSQPLSRESSGADLALSVTWLGLTYGIIDGLFLNVMPVVAVWQGFAQTGWSASWPGKIAVAAIALAASLLVTAAYHVGYAEFRNSKVGLVLVGNSLISLAYLISGNPLGGIVSHVAMHVAAVLQGPETTIQLPPHY